MSGSIGGGGRLPAIKESIFDDIPVNVTLLFSREQYLAAAGASMRGLERRLKAGLNPNAGSVASAFVSRWDTAATHKVPAGLRNKPGIVIAMRAYKADRDLLTPPRRQRVYNGRAAQLQKVGSRAAVLVQAV